MFISKFFLLLLTTTAVSARNPNWPNCNIPLDPETKDSHHHSCIQACLGKHYTQENSFVCDISAEWMHHVGGSNNPWYPATPPKGTGVHEYVAYTGTPPCRQNGHCKACDKQLVVGKKLCSVWIDPETCAVTCDETSNLMESLTDF